MRSTCLAHRRSSWLLVERPLTDVSLLFWSSGVGRFGHHLVLESERSDCLRGVGRGCSMEMLKYLCRSGRPVV